MELQSSRKNIELEESIDRYDEYGFAVFQIGSMNALYDERDHNFSPENVSVGLDKEWGKVMDKWPAYKNSLGSKLTNLVKNGVPGAIRPQLWKKLLDSDHMKTNSHFTFQNQTMKVREQLVQFGVTEYNTVRAEEELSRIEINKSHPKLNAANEALLNIRQIFLDVVRTFPTHEMFFGETPRAIEGRATLFRILAAYTRFNPSVGYCQGMSFIAGMLSTILPEEDSFWCLVALLEKPKYLCGYFDKSLGRVQRHAQIFHYVLQKRLPDLWNHLNAHKVDPLMYVTPWLMCLFTCLPCWDCVLSIWDLMLLEGVTIVFRAALAIMAIMRPTLMAIHDGNILILTLQKLPPTKINKNTLLPAIAKTSISIWQITCIQDLLDEEEEKKKKATVANELATSSAPKTWKKVRQRIASQSAEIGDSSLLRKISSIFNVRKRSLATVDTNGPDIVVTSTMGDSESINGCKQSKDEVSFKGPANKRDKRKAPPSRYINNLNTSTNEDLNRIQRLVRGRRNYTFQSSESLEEYSVGGTAASQRMAFEEFSHQVPLRENQRSHRNLRLPESYSETELKYLADGSPPPKRNRISDSRSFCGISFSATPSPAASADCQDPETTQKPRIHKLTPLGNDENLGRERLFRRAKNNRAVPIV